MVAARLGHFDGRMQRVGVPTVDSGHSIGNPFRGELCAAFSLGAAFYTNSLSSVDGAC